MILPDGFDALLMAGIPSANASLYQRIRFAVGDPVAFIVAHNGSVLILRDIEMARARAHARADTVACPADYAPPAGLSGDRETATAQAAAECLHRLGAQRVIADRTLPLLYASILGEAGIEVVCDAGLGVDDRRVKDASEIAWLRTAQEATESAVEMACRLIAHATADSEGVLQHGGASLTSERLRFLVDVHLLELGYANPVSIIAPGPQGADCHHVGSGPLRTASPVIIDIFPCNRDTRYNGDCTRTVVHGDVPDALQRMHAAVVHAKAAASAAIRAGVTGDAVHQVTTAYIEAHGYRMGFQQGDTDATMPHGTGHGVGLDLHEPPLLAPGGPRLLAGDVVTVEPGLYAKQLGGVRVEDMVVVTEEGCANLNRLPEGLDWR